MADVEEPQFTTLAERIAALNRQKNFEAPDTRPKRAPPPPPPDQRPAAETRSQTLPVVTTTKSNHQAEAPRPAIPPRPTKSAAPPPLPRRPTGASEAGDSPVVSPGIAPPPPLPSRNSSNQPSPALPHWRSKSQSTPATDLRRNSTSSEISHISNLSSVSAGRTSTSNTSSTSDGSTRKLPPAFDAASLPPLPPTRRELEAKAREAKEEAGGDARSRHPLVTSKTLPNVRQLEPPPSARPSLPPRLPSRPAKSPASHQAEFNKPATPRRLPPPPAEYKSFTNGSKTIGDVPPPLPSTSRDTRDPAPPVPVCSRPSQAQIEAASTRTVAGGAASASCIVCRDYSAPDRVGAQYPRQTVPRNDPVGFLAHGLCDPFHSATDKARAIFTWMHHNVVYDWELFQSGGCRRVTPEDVIFEGKAVCAGYAGAYEAIAKRAGMECIVVSGHGKGVGYKDKQKGEPCPPKNATGHAWNAVRIDGGEWKLIDACWGAGHLDSSTGQHKQEFNPRQFTKSNEDFGASHFPSDSRFFFRSDGRIPSWDEYFTGGIDGPPAHVYGDFEREGCHKPSLSPKEREIPVYSGGVVRFQMSKPCEHWSFEKNGLGAPRLFLLSIKGQDGRKDTQIPMDTDGFWWWTDVNARDLGAPGQSVTMIALTKLGDRDARGVTKEEFLRSQGRVGMAWSFLAKWELI